MQQPYKEWAEGHINKIKAVLDGSRAEHTQAVKERIHSVEQMKDVVEVTKGLFALSRVRLLHLPYSSPVCSWFMMSPPVGNCPV